MSIPTHDVYSTQRDIAKAHPTPAKFWVGNEVILHSEDGEIHIGYDPDEGGIAFHVGDEISFTLETADLLEAVSKVLR